MPVAVLGRQRQEKHTFWATLGYTVRPCLRNQKQSCYLLDVRSSLKIVCLKHAGDTEGQAVGLLYVNIVISTGCFVYSEWCTWEEANKKGGQFVEQIS